MIRIVLAFGYTMGMIKIGSVGLYRSVDSIGIKSRYHGFVVALERAKESERNRAAL